MSRTIPKDAVALIIRKDSQEGYLDLQVIAPETEDNEYLVSIGNLAANLLEQAMFGTDEEAEDEESFELDPDFLGSLDLGDD